MEQHEATFWFRTNWEGVATKEKSEDLPSHFPDAFGLKSREWMHFYPHLVSDISLRYCFSTF
jgi:hypothetical protein